jgi:hypothetical protein
MTGQRPGPDRAAAPGAGSTSDSAPSTSTAATMWATTSGGSSGAFTA